MNQEQARARQELMDLVTVRLNDYDALPGPNRAKAATLVDDILSGVSLLMQVVGAVEIPWCAEHDGPMVVQDACNDFEIEPLCRLEEPARHWTIGDKT